jgi:hypothetical protein
MDRHLIPLPGDWALWRDFAVRSAGFPVGGLDVFGSGDESARLGAIAADPLFGEAVIWQSRSAYRTAVAKIAGRGAEPGSKRRRRDGVVAGYWQRYWDEPAIGVEILSGTDRVAMAVACPLDDHEREPLGERKLLTPGELPHRDGAMQQHDSWPLTNATNN